MPLKCKHLVGFVTEYVYQVEAYNSEGSAYSFWDTGRTREARTYNLRKPSVNQIILSIIEVSDQLQNTIKKCF